MGTRLATVAVGIWLFVSPFLWAHATTRMISLWITGLAVVVVGLVSVAVPRARLLNLPVGLWLVLTGLAWPAVAPATRWHDLALGALVIVLALLPTRRAAPGQPAPRAS